MKKYILLIFFICSLSFAKAQTTFHTININGDLRGYYVYKPTGFNPQTENLPLIFALHGLGGNAAQMMMTGFNQIADTARIIMVYPEGKLNQYNQQAWANGTALQSNTDDVLFVSAMIDSVFYQSNINLNRVYVVGLSMGGIMAHRLGCRLSNRIAAIASMTGTISTYDLTNCTPTFAMPVIHWHGTADGTVPYDSGQIPTLELVPSTINYWLAKNNCTPLDTIVTTMPDLVADNITVDKIQYLNCPGNVSVELWRFNNGPHTWFYQPANDVDGAKEFWNFFRPHQHSNPTPAGIKTKNSNTGIKLYPNPSSNGLIHVSAHAIIDRIDVYTFDGKLVLTESPKNTDDELLLEKGIYFIKILSGEILQTEKIIVE
jgi:polyhydroxybutyrate depolymerase